MNKDLKGIFDIHCHIMFGVDDGAKSREQSERMLEMAYSEGIRNIILTPHYGSRAYDVSRETILERFAELKALALDMYGDMNIYMGNELQYSDKTAEDLKSGTAFTMADSRFVLVEFSIAISYDRIRQAVMELMQYGYIPILAHVERYDSLIRNSEYIAELSDMGACIQVNASSVIGKNGRKTEKMVAKLLKREKVDFIATDAHRDDKRAPEIKSCVDRVIKKYGQSYAERLFIRNPHCIIDNKYIEE